MNSNQTGLRIMVLLLLFTAIFPAGCKKKEEPKILGPVVVTVNGTAIREGQVLAEIQPILDVLAQNDSQKLPPAWVEQFIKQQRQTATEKLVVAKLLDDKVKEANIVVTEEQAMDELKKALAEQEEPKTIEEFKKELAARKESFEEIMQKIRTAISYEKLFEPYIAGKINISDSDANSYYALHTKEFETPEQVRASHILISVKETDSNEVKAQARAKIETILAKLKAGADFAELARTDSNDTGSAKNGGDLAFFSKGIMTEPFEKVAFELKPGQISDIVETEFGYHIVKVTDRKDAETIPFEDVKEQIIKNLKRDKEDKLAEKYIKSLKDNAKITYTPGNEPVGNEPLSNEPVDNEPVGNEPADNEPNN